MFLSQIFHCIATLTGLCVHQSLWVGGGHALIGLAESRVPFLEAGIESMLPQAYMSILWGSLPGNSGAISRKRISEFWVVKALLFTIPREKAN